MTSGGIAESSVDYRFSQRQAIQCRQYTSLTISGHFPIWNNITIGQAQHV